MLNVMTVDVEDWYQTSDFNFPVTEWSRFERRVEVNTNRILDLFGEYQIKATFFVLGCVAREFPEMVKDIVKRGHEVGSHGTWHQLLTRMTLEDIRRDISDSKHLLEDLTGTAVTCYRAPSWSISSQRYEILTLLDEMGFQVDSSLQPFRTPLSGISNAPIDPFHPIVAGRELRLLEFPPTVLHWGGRNIPFSGGLYMRVWPKWMVKRCLQQVNCIGRTGMVYLHPWEFDVHQPRTRCSSLTRFTHYYNLQSTEAKLRMLLEEFQFHRLCDEISNSSYGAKVLS